MDHPLGDALMVEMEDFLAQDEVFQQRRTALARAKAVLVIGNRDALLGRHRAVGILGGLVGFAAMALGLGIMGRRVRSGRKSSGVGRRLSLCLPGAGFGLVGHDAAFRR